MNNEEHLSLEDIDVEQPPTIEVNSFWSQKEDPSGRSGGGLFVTLEEVPGARGSGLALFVGAEGELGRACVNGAPDDLRAALSSFTGGETLSELFRRFEANIQDRRSSEGEGTYGAEGAVVLVTQEETEFGPGIFVNTQTYGGVVVMSVDRKGNCEPLNRPPLKGERGEEYTALSQEAYLEKLVENVRGRVREVDIEGHRRIERKLDDNYLGGEHPQATFARVEITDQLIQQGELAVVCFNEALLAERTPKQIAQTVRKNSARSEAAAERIVQTPKKRALLEDRVAGVTIVKIPDEKRAELFRLSPEQAERLRRENLTLRGELEALEEALRRGSPSAEPQVPLQEEELEREKMALEERIAALEEALREAAKVPRPPQAEEWERTLEAMRAAHKGAMEAQRTEFEEKYRRLREIAAGLREAVRLFAEENPAFAEVMKKLEELAAEAQRDEARRVSEERPPEEIPPPEMPPPEKITELATVYGENLEGLLLLNTDLLKNFVSLAPDKLEGSHLQAAATFVGILRAFESPQVLQLIFESYGKNRVQFIGRKPDDKDLLIVGRALLLTDIVHVFGSSGNPEKQQKVFRRFGIKEREEKKIRELADKYGAVIAPFLAFRKGKTP